MQYWRNNTEEVSIDLWRLIHALWKKAWIIALTAVIFGATFFAYSAYCVVPTYRASFTAYVNSQMAKNDSGSVTSGELNASIGLTYLYEEIISSRSVLMDAAESCGLKSSHAEIASKVKTSISETAAIITVVVEDTNPDRAVLLASAIADVAPGHVARVVDGSSMRIVDAPVRPNGKYAPNNTSNAMLGAVAGMVLAIIILAVIELVDDTVQNEEELEKRYSMVVVGTIPHMDQAQKARGIYGYRKVGSGNE